MTPCNTVTDSRLLPEKHARNGIQYPSMTKFPFNINTEPVENQNYLQIQRIQMPLDGNENCRERTSQERRQEPHRDLWKQELEPALAIPESRSRRRWSLRYLVVRRS